MNRPIFRLIYGRGLLSGNGVIIYTANYKYNNNNILQYPFGYVSYPIIIHKNVEFTNFKLITECNQFNKTFCSNEQNTTFLGFNKDIINQTEHSINIKNNTSVQYLYWSTKNYEKLLIKPFL